jgi:predicted ATPase
MCRYFPEAGHFHLRRAGSGLSPARRMEESTICQVVMATHSPVLMAYPGARLLRLTKYELEPASVTDTDHCKVMREFCADPAGFVEAVIDEWKPHRRDDDRF